MVHTKTYRDALKNFSTSLFDFFAPRCCSSCNNKLTLVEEFICTRCLTSLVVPDDKLLIYEYGRKFSSRQVITQFSSLFLFEKDKELQNIIHSIKYRNKFLTAEYLGKLASEKLHNKLTSWNIDIIIPVPLHRLKTAERGYNQSYYFAKGLAAGLNIPLINNAVKRKRYTTTQTMMTFPQREKNMSGAFVVVRPEKIKGKNIILADDVITTGATINECAKALKKKGAGNIYAVSAGLAE